MIDESRLMEALGCLSNTGLWELWEPLIVMCVAGEEVWNADELREEYEQNLGFRNQTAQFCKEFAKTLLGRGYGYASQSRIFKG